DQRPDDALSLVFDSAILDVPLEILGGPVVDLTLESDQPVAQIAVRLNEVAPNGESTRVTWGVLNLTHRDGHNDPKPLEVGHRTRAVIKMNEAGHRFSAGSRIRLALSTSYWPIVWPSPVTPNIT